MAEQSPFPYQGPLAPEQVSGRDALVRDLAERLAARRLTALLGPRRFGKTSVLKRVTTDLAETTGAETIWIDLYGLSSMADLAGAIDRGLSGVGGAVRRILDSVAGSLSVNLGVVGVELSKGKRDRPDPALLLRSLLQILVRTAQRHDLIVVFDEFAGIANVDQAAAVLRTELQHHYRDLAIVFAGSQPSTMRMLFTDEAQPFFAQADLVEIWPLARAAVATSSSGASRPRVATPAAPPARWSRWRRGTRSAPCSSPTRCGGARRREAPPSDETWEEALADVRRNVDNGSDRLFALLPVGHQKTLRVIAAGGSVHGTAADVLELASGTATAAVDALIGNGYVVRRDDDGRLRIVDPMLADWIRRRFPV